MKEIWKDIKGYEGLYKVSSRGRVKRLRRAYRAKSRGEGYHTRIDNDLIMSTGDNGKGYKVICLRKNGEKKQKYVHRLVAKAFIANPENKDQINHKDCDKSNNHVSNLEWSTINENMKHASENGLLVCSEYQKKQISKANTGSGHGLSRLRESDILIIRNMRSKGMTYQRIADRFDVNRATIGCIIRGKTWTHV